MNFFVSVFKKLMTSLRVILCVLSFIIIDTSLVQANFSRSMDSFDVNMCSSSSIRRSTNFTNKAASMPSRFSQNSQYTRQSQPNRRSFMHGLAGGIIGGMIGNLFFNSFNQPINNSFGSPSIGLLDVLIIGAGFFLLWHFIKKRKE